MDVTDSTPLMDRVHAALRTGHYSHLTEKAYVAWIRRYIVFHGKRHPADLGAEHVGAFLIALLNNLLNFMDVSKHYQLVAQAMIIILAVSVYVERRRMV